MAIDYSGFAIPKSRVKALDTADAKAKVATTDKKENAKVKKRSGGQCEVRILVGDMSLRVLRHARCTRPGIDPHHLIGGIGRRNQGKSILADYKLWVCRQCHEDIGAKILRPTTAEHDAQTVRFWRAR